MPEPMKKEKLVNVLAITSFRVAIRKILDIASVPS